MTGPRTPPSMEAITESIERSLQNCSLGNNNYGTSAAPGGGRHRSSSSSVSESAAHRDSSNDNSLELNSQIRLPYYWEQCLDLNTGEVYYINWRTGIKSRHHPRMMNQRTNNINVGHRGVGFAQEMQEQGYDSDGSYSEEEEEEEEEEEVEEEEEQEEEEKEQEESSPSSSANTTTAWRSERRVPPIPTNLFHSDYQVESENESRSNNEFNYNIIKAGGGGEVLVVAGCKGCFMYLMVPKQVEECPKCCGQLLHFDRSDN